MTYKLIDQNTNAELKTGDIVKTILGEQKKLEGFRPPLNARSTGRVILTDDHAKTAEYYPSVINAKIVHNSNVDLDKLANALTQPLRQPTESPPFDPPYKIRGATGDKQQQPMSFKGLYPRFKNEARDKLMAMQPTKIGTVLGIQFYEHPMNGGDVGMIALQGNDLYQTDWYDLPRECDLQDD